MTTQALKKLVYIAKRDYYYNTAFYNHKPMETKVTHIIPPRQIGRYVAMIGALALGVAAFLPWIVADNITMKGMEGRDGIIILGLAVVTLLFLFIKRIPLWISTILGFVAGVIGFYNSYSAAKNLNELQDLLKNNFLDPLTNENIGIGLYLTILASALIVFGSLIQWIKNSKK